jgi:hypothetical protein
MKTNGLALEADILAVSSKACRQLEKLQLQENDGLRTTLLAVYWALLHHEESVAQEFGERCTLNSDTVVRKLQGNDFVLTSPSVLPCCVHLFLLLHSGSKYRCQGVQGYSFTASYDTSPLFIQRYVYSGVLACGQLYP